MDDLENKNAGELYTLGIWIVKPGMEKGFVNEWSQFAHWTIDNFPGNSQAHLLQDEKNPLRFISFGPWKDAETIQRWRDSREFKDFVIKVKELLDEFQPNTLKEVVTAG